MHGQGGTCELQPHFNAVLIFSVAKTITEFLKSHFCVLTQQVPGKLSMKLNTICELRYYLGNKLKSFNIF